MERKEYLRFFEQFLCGESTEDDHRIFLKWFNSLDAREAGLVMKDYERLALNFDQTGKTDPFLIRRLEARLEALEEEVFVIEEPESNPWYRVVLRWTAAAAIVIALFVGFQNLQNEQKKFKTAGTDTKVPDIAPGDYKAELILADGASVMLNSAGLGEIAAQDHLSVEKKEEGLLVYNPSAGFRTTNKFSQSGHNVVKTPKSGQFQIILPDGTKVHLNSMSSIRFPISFDPEERRVELTGEAYFDVQKASFAGKKIPFRVVSDNQIIEVTGTKFNVNTYADDALIKTTLAEGQVVVTESQSGRTVKLRPGEQSLVSPTGQDSENVRNRLERIFIRKADVEGDLAWTNGYFHFNNTGLPEVMQQLSRWYNIEIDLTGELPSERFNGYVSRNVSLSNVLAMLEHGTDIRFKMIGNGRVSVMPSGSASP